MLSIARIAGKNGLKTLDEICYAVTTHRSRTQSFNKWSSKRENYGKIKSILMMLIFILYPKIMKE